MSAVVMEEQRGKARVLRINRPDDANRINRLAMRELGAAVGRANADATVRVVIITGSRSAFCSGGRVDGHPEGTIDQRLAFAQSFADLQRDIAHAHKPVIAAVEGQCIAGGMSVLSACDLAVACDDVRFGFPEINFGLFPMLAMGVAHPLLPPKTALELFLTGRDMTAKEALDLRLINQSVPHADLWTAVDALVEELASKSEVPLKHGRTGYYAMAGMSDESRLDHAKVTLIGMLAAVGDEGAVPQDH